MKIEKNIEIPPDPRGKKRIYPIEQMEIGDSFVVPTATQRRGAEIAAKRYGVKVTTRKLKGDDGKFVWRVWRIA